MELFVAKRMNQPKLEKFAEDLKKIQRQFNFKISSRGWCYQLESARLFNKDDFDHIESLINKCRRTGLLPIDFVAEEEGRQFSGVETETYESPTQYLKGYIEAPLNCHRWYTPDWWDGEEYYIQMLVEKIDLKTLFEPICKDYHIPIATSKGWSSMLQRATYARRFKDAQDRGLKCVLLYCGDHDPDGLRISDFLRSNLADIQDIHWYDGTEGYNPENLIIERFGLNYDFIVAHRLTWIDNLITGSGLDLSSTKHKNHKQPYVQQYLGKFGVRKCEANAIVPMPDIARDFVRDEIEKWVGTDALSRFEEKTEKVYEDMWSFDNAYEVRESIEKTIELL